MGFVMWFTQLGIFFFIVSCYAEKAPFTSFAKDATSAPPEEYYDYIIVGGGPAGCGLAATLSSSAKVLLLERGNHPYDDRNLTHIDGYGASLADASPTSAAQPFISTDGVYNHRARVLGGGSSINAGFYTRASTEQVAEAGWDPQLVEESYEWVERKIVFRPRLGEWQSAFRDGLLEAGVSPYNGFTYEHLNGTKIGGLIFDEFGIRHSAADLLEYANPDKITLYLNATAHQILFTSSSSSSGQSQRPKANGVLFKDTKGTRHVAYLNSGPTNEIILSAGAIGSPHLLLLSGIGPGHQLKARGIEVIVDQPMVGQGLSDNPLNVILIPTLEHVERSVVQVVGITQVGSYIEASSRVLFPGSIVAQSFADLVKQMIPPLSHNETIQDLMIIEKIRGPFSTGYLELNSTDLNDNPIVTFNYFEDKRDLQRCVRGIEIVREVIESGPVSEFRHPSFSFQSLIELMALIPNNLRTRHVTGSYSVEQFCNETLTTMYHYHGGCQVNGVVDGDYKVIGADALRVIDGSTLFQSPGANPQATLMMLGRYMGQKILRDRIQNHEN